MPTSHRLSQYDAVLGFASQDASVPANTAAPPGYTSDKGPLHGQQDLDLGLDQMFLDSVGSFNDNPSTSGQQSYNTRQDLTQSQTRDDEADPIATLHRQSRYQDQDYSLQDAVGDNDGRYLQVPPAPWNTVVAANDLQQAHLSGSYQTPTRQPSHMVSDEGYYTFDKSQQDTRSVISDRSASFGQTINNTQAIPRSIPEGQRVRAYSQGQAGDGSMASQETTTRRPPRSEAESVSGNISCEVENCDWTGKTHSDFKKHCARHDLHHICDHQDCIRNGKGFATVNDLQRHKKSVHKIMIEGDRYYRCFAKGCSKPEKDWPRKDNFRSHLRKTHPNEDVEKLVKMSEAWWDNVGQNIGIQSEAPGISVQLPENYQDSSVQETQYYQQALHPNTPYPSSSASDSGLPHSSPVSRVPFSNSSWAQHDAMYIPNLIPGTLQYKQQQYNLQQAQAMARQGYQIGNAYAESSSPLQSTHRIQRVNNEFLRNQQRPRSQKASMPHATLHPPYAFQGGQISTQLHVSSPSTQQAAEPIARQMSRTTSVNPPNLQSQTQAPNAIHSWNTVADPRSLEEERRREMTQMPAAEPSDASSFQGYVNQANDLTQIGWVVNAFDYPGSTSSTSMMPQSVPQTVAISQSQANNNEDVVKQIKDFLETRNNKAENGQLINVITSALRSLYDRGAGGPSRDVSRLEVNADDYIDETINEGGKPAFRCKWEKAGQKCISAKKLWGLRSEIKKHIKRHTKPFGCTFENCYKRFGSKSDWMRHEIKRHQQQECWRCDISTRLPAPGLQPCRKTFGKMEQFMYHLEHVHEVTNPREVNLLLTKQHINSGFQPQYWCGFCREIQKLTHKGKQGYHERYDHVAKHISEEERSIDDWYPPGGKFSKREILARKTKTSSSNHEITDDEDGDADEDEHDVSLEDSTGEGSLSSNSPQGETPARSSTPQPHHQPLDAASFQQYQPESSNSNSNKRSASIAGLQQSQQHVQRRANFWRCHDCQGDNVLATSPACVCGHQRCQGCTPFWEPSNEERGAVYRRRT